ncbi:MAG TPA: hypothetical protein DCX54_12160 [Flavobacteriales bacterium]|nr:hypothetical protein [Flavobacteriales bacterium]
MDVMRFNYSNKELRELAFKIRREVFIEEQMVDESEEFDEYENSSVHYLAMDSGEAIGTSRWRITSEGIKLERFAVKRAHRANGVGAALMSTMLADLPPLQPVYLHAQVQVLDFYKKLGFETVGNLFVECNIDHFAMRLNEQSGSSISLGESIDCVREFHEAFGLHVAHKPLAKVDEKLYNLRFELMKEENEEYLKAAQEGDLVEIADALGDMLYILNGTIITHGLQAKIGLVFKEIQRSNMSKLDESGNPIYREDGKVLKSNRYFKPNIAKVLEG